MSDIGKQLRNRRAASRRLPCLEHIGRSDPWHYEPPTRGYAEAAAYLLAHGMTPAPNITALRDMWKAGDEELADARAIVECWREAST